ncbi:MAG: response regulator [Candidatus Omnitrophica bacterium]|nr:response regulator [Candidatus Omnitrophota bacterium]
MAHKILIVDDERINMALVKFGLSEQRYQVVEAKDGVEGIEKVKEEKPNLIVLDIQMPNMNGYEFMAELKSLDDIDPPPVIMLTASDSMEDLFRMEGVKDYFVKPVDLKALAKSIKNILGENPAASGEE